MDIDIESFFILALLLMVPASIVFSILMYIRIRRGKYRRHRIRRSKKK